ncbi:uncharacterized protein TRIADDRAFT_54991 [Trichoplax adhaerens]|uniref:GRIP domain-containing protein n=1 Tax=Trichoplax adhaerens TaxID=10228 RepID=B3RQH6_TRIAD|nr:hypothetical protein TRIADDRAFT_54991 [Trichoplax adhaerens]EDV27245.1 hypothetical protein TRIADDRAFT_54991 [Trichoplax adhaerens]|eukprot:XP_002111241.1 hypothetical protein TRIADDRAFT_54991 [Trichoplax adhaerens]
MASVNSSFSEVNQRFFGDSPQSFYGKNAYYNDNMEERSFSSDGAPLSPSKDSPPSAAEFEYLRNALFQYMVGRERLQMSKVLVALARFTSIQSQKILAKEQERDKNKSWLG